MKYPLIKELPFMARGLAVCEAAGKGAWNTARDSLGELCFVIEEDDEICRITLPENRREYAIHIAFFDPATAHKILFELKSALARERDLQLEICEDNHGWYDLTEEEYAKERGWHCYDEESDTK